MADSEISLIPLHQHPNTPNPKAMIIGILFAGHELPVLKFKFPVKIIFYHNAVHASRPGDVDRDNLFLLLAVLFDTLNGIIYGIGKYCLKINYGDTAEITGFHRTSQTYSPIVAEQSLFGENGIEQFVIRFYDIIKKIRGILSLPIQLLPSALIRKTQCLYLSFQVMALLIDDVHVLF